MGDPGVSGGFCRSIPSQNAAAIRDHHAFGMERWVNSATGTTFLPPLVFEKLPGWSARYRTLYGEEAWPCDVQSFVASLSSGDGIYSDPGVSGGLCRRIPAQNAAAIRDHHRFGMERWISSATGATLLPPQKAEDHDDSEHS